MHDEIPRNLNARTLMHEWFAIEFRAKQAKPEQAPAIERFWSPETKNHPAIFPQKQLHLLAKAPRRFVDRFLIVKFHGLDGFASSRGLNEFTVSIRTEAVWV